LPEKLTEGVTERGQKDQNTLAHFANLQNVPLSAALSSPFPWPLMQLLPRRCPCLAALASSPHLTDRRCIFPPPRMQRQGDGSETTMARQQGKGSSEAAVALAAMGGERREQ